MDKELQFLIYNTPEENVSVNAVIKDETIWLTQKAMAELFGVGVPAISKHLANIYAEGELNEISTVSKMEIVQQEGSRDIKRNMEFYNLDAIISVGYRVNSRKATNFRIWATGILKEYMIKGFAMDDERLKQGKTAFGKDYFKELLERVRSIRASERRIWQQITDIFAECSIDYDKDSQTTHDFYAMVQNKFHYAITGQTAAEIIDTKADHTKEHMGLTTWKNSPDGRILKSDVTIAKNYLDEKQIRQLERAVTGYFDYIEDLIERENTFTMTEFAASINEFLAFRKYDVLEGKGRISKKTADYRSKYNDIREWIRREREGKEKGNSKIDWDDVVFEVDLLKSQEINLDYILELIYEKNKNTKDKNMLIDEIRRIVRASTGNRAKESLIVAFINQTDLDEIQDKASIIDAFFQFAQKEQKREAEELIMEEKLNEEAAKRYILTSLRKEYASENGTDLNEILPKMSPLNPQYHTKKQSVFEKISTFVEKFKGVGGVI